MTCWLKLQQATKGRIEMECADQGYTMTKATYAAEERDITLKIIKLPHTKQGFVLLPRLLIVEKFFAWATRFRRFVKDYERYASTL
ncbi:MULTISPECIES: hypothetical protein [unclassified Acetobacter]|uniref:hypothetical protein n=1 Tax=Acetobacter TaxID=434 RepID=UPI00351AB3B9